MQTYYSAKGVFTLQVQGDSNGYNNCIIYRRSKTAMKILHNQSDVMRRFRIDVNGELSSSRYYWCGISRELVIPMRDVIAMCAPYRQGEQSRVNIRVIMDSGENTSTIDSIDIYANVQRGISYNDIKAPLTKGIDVTGGSGANVIVPPNVMYRRSLGAIGSIVESNATGGYWYNITEYGGYESVSPSGERSNQIVCQAYVRQLLFSDGREARWRFDTLDECTPSICLKWLSMTGAVRQHHFPVVQYLRGTDGETSFMTPADGYEVRKAPTTGVRCVVKGLNAYGLWYYADLLQASGVHGIIGGSALALDDVENLVYIQSTDVEINAGANGLYDFDFIVKWRHYDTD